MSYYGQGDFYGGGGYYRGDPGFFSFLGKAAKGLVGAIPGVGPAISAGIDVIKGAKKSSSIVKAVEVPAAAGRASSIVTKATGIIKKHPILSGAAAAGVGGLVSGATGVLATRALRTMHGGGERKRRRMNPCNARALRRAIRRAHAFERLAKKVIGFSSPRKPKGRMYFRAKRKR